MLREEKVSITNGPSAHELVDGLKYACNKQRPHRPEFSILPADKSASEKRQTVILSLEYGDGSGESFKVKGILIPPANSNIHAEIFSGYYNAKRRSGTFTISHQ